MKRGGRTMKSPVVVKHDEGEVLVYGEPVHFSPSQYAVVRALVSAKGKIVSREVLMREVYGNDEQDEHDVRVVDQVVHHVRELLGKASECLVTVTDRGYKWKVQK